MSGQIPKISVIIPVHDAEKYLCACLDSVREQTFRDIEIICVDDGSRDRSWDILRCYAQEDTRFRLFRRETASGSGAVPRNVGLDAAAGEYVSILDADDWFDRRMLERMWARAAERGADLVMCDNYVVLAGGCSNGEGELHHAFLPPLDSFSWRDIPDTIFQISNATAWHKLIQRKLIEEHGLRFQEGVPILDDICFVNLVDVYAKRIAVLDEKLVYYRSETDGAQTTKIASHPDSIYLAFSALHSRLRETGLYQAVAESLRVWTLNTCEWWMSCIHDYGTYRQTMERFRTDWFQALDLRDTNTRRLTPRLDNFYRAMVGEPHSPTRQELLERFPDGTRIALYGAGAHGKKAHRFLLSYGKHRLAAWCDRNAAKLNRPGVDPPERLRSVDFDVVMIAIYDPETARAARRDLRQLGIPDEKIVVYQ